MNGRTKIKVNDTNINTSCKFTLSLGRSWCFGFV
jgi:hypothetical protein